VKEFVKYLDARNPCHGQEPIFITGEKDVQGRVRDVVGNDSYTENVLPFTNNIPTTRWRPAHMAGFTGALTRTINNYRSASGIAKKEKISLPAMTAREGLT